MATISLDGENLRVELGAWDHLWAFSGSLSIPLSHIRDVVIADEGTWSRVWAKLIGTSVPGFKTAGTFFSKDGLVFCDYTNGKSCVEITTEHEFYKKVVIQLDDGRDPAAVRDQILAAIAH